MGKDTAKTKHFSCSAENIDHLSGLKKWNIPSKIEFANTVKTDSKTGRQLWISVDDGRNSIGLWSGWKTSLSLLPFLCSLLDPYNCSKVSLTCSKFGNLKKSFLTFWMHIISESQNWTHKPSENRGKHKRKTLFSLHLLRKDVLSSQ